MAYSPADKRRVYLACRAIFAGNNALLRKSKKIRELVVSHNAALAPIIRDFKVEKVLEILKILLEGQVFQSDVKAKIEFPELFRSSPTRDVQRTTSENDAARSVAEVLEEIASVEDRENVSEEGGENSEVASIQDRAAGKQITKTLRAGELTLLRLGACRPVTEHTFIIPFLLPISRSTCHYMQSAVRPRRVLL